MAKKKSRTTQKVSLGRHIRAPYAVGLSSNYANLSRNAMALFNDLEMQMSSHFNGTLVITLSAMPPSRWKSAHLLYRARDELLHYGFITLTRQGGKNRASYYALTFINIEAKEGLDVRSTSEPSDDYKIERPKFEGNPAPRKPPEKQNPCSPHVINDLETVPPTLSIKCTENVTVPPTLQVSRFFEPNSSPHGIPSSKPSRYRGPTPGESAWGAST